MFNLGVSLTRESLEEYYRSVEGYAGVYGRGLWRAYRRAAYEAVRPRLQALGRPLRVLDIGGGAMISLPELVADPTVAEYTIVDLVISPELPGGKVRAVRADATEYLASCSPASFDAVVVFGVLYYWGKDKGGGLLSAIKRVVRADGCVLIHEPNAAAKGLVEDFAEPFDLEPVAAQAGLTVLERGRSHIPWLRRAVARWERLTGRPLGQGSCAVLLGVERRWGGGVDTLCVLRP